MRQCQRPQSKAPKTVLLILIIIINWLFHHFNYSIFIPFFPLLPSFLTCLTPPSSSPDFPSSSSSTLLSFSFASTGQSDIAKNECPLRRSPTSNPESPSNWPGYPSPVLLLTLNSSNHLSCPAFSLISPVLQSFTSLDHAALSINFSYSTSPPG